MDETTTTQAPLPLLGADWSDPLEDGVRGRVRAFIEGILEEELSGALGRGRYDRSEASGRGWRNGHRDRQVIGTFGAETISVPRARLVRDDGSTAEWRSKGLRRYQRLTRRAEALIAGAYLAGTNTRRVRRALPGLTGLNYNILSGSVRLFINGIGGGVRQAVINVGLDARVVDLCSFRTLYATSLQRQVIGREVEAGSFSFFGNNLIEFRPCLR